MKWEGEENLDNYQDLLCFICGATKPGSMTICKNELDSRHRNDDFARDGYTASCPQSKCLSNIGNSGYYKEIVLFEKKYVLLNWINENPFEVKQ